MGMIILEMSWRMLCVHDNIKYPTRRVSVQVHVSWPYSDHSTKLNMQLLDKHVHAHIYETNGCIFCSKLVGNGQRSGNHGTVVACINPGDETCIRN